MEHVIKLSHREYYYLQVQITDTLVSLLHQYANI